MLYAADHRDWRTVKANALRIAIKTPEGRDYRFPLPASLAWSQEWVRAIGVKGSNFHSTRTGLYSLKSRSHMAPICKQPRASQIQANETAQSKTARMRADAAPAAPVKIRWRR